MRPVDLAQLEYDETSPRTFVEDFAFFANHGYIYSGDDAFIMARPIERRADKFILDRGIKFRNPDAWFVYLAAGKGALRRFTDLAPFKAEWVCWHRRTDNVLRYHSWDLYERKTKKWEVQK
tara:strand:+ start:429 stop:791 length:363 start_codon:yes stop_codon:yes gene_type:complete